MDRWWSADHTTGVIVVVAFLGFFMIIFGTLCAYNISKAPYEDAVFQCSMDAHPSEFCAKLVDEISVQKRKMN